jgi:hypothetical protein
MLRGVATAVPEDVSPASLTAAAMRAAEAAEFSIARLPEMGPVLSSLLYSSSATA